MPGQNGLHYACDIFKCTFREKTLDLKKISSRSFDLLGIKSVIVDVVTWRRTGNKPLPQPMTTHLTDAHMASRSR